MSICGVRLSMAQWPWRCIGEARAQGFASVNRVRRRQICINRLFIVSASVLFLAASALPARHGAPQLGVKHGNARWNKQRCCQGG